MIGSQHEDDALPFIHPIEEAVIPDAMPPRFWNSVAKLLDVLPEVGIVADLRIDVRAEFVRDARLLALKILAKILLELRRLEHTEFSQQICLSAALRLGARPAV